jgi:hypothetical protein
MSGWVEATLNAVEKQPGMGRGTGREEDEEEDEEEEEDHAGTREELVTLIEVLRLSMSPSAEWARG